MFSCPFLRTWSPSSTQKNVYQAFDLIQQCPIAKRVFSVDCRGNASRYSSAVTIESTTDVNCDKSSNNVSRKCPVYNGWKDIKTNDVGSSSIDKDFETKKIDSNNSSSKFNFSDFFTMEIQKKKSDSTYRVFRKVLRDATQFPFADELSSGFKRRISVWCSNDYMGLSWHPKVQEAAVSTIYKHGVGSGGTRNISGNSVLHETLEAELADLHGKQSALVFSSCYVANESVLHTLGTRISDLTILSDSANHASMIHGIRTSRCRKMIYKHNDFKHLELLMDQLPSESPKLVAFESVHSMSGDICPLKELLDVIEAKNAFSFLDEVHAVGLYGSRGAGVAERDGQLHRVDAITGTLGKAYASFGGYLAGNSDLVDMIRSYASGFIFTTSLPPHTLAAAIESVKILKSSEGEQLRKEHGRRIRLVREQLVDAGLPIIDTPSHIIPVHVGDAKLCTQIMEDLLNEHGIYIQAINHPTVNKGHERLRIAPTPYHTDELTDQLVQALCTVWNKYDLFSKK